MLSFVCGCKKEDLSNSASNSTIAQEIEPAKTFYANGGGTFKFRLYHFPPTEGDNNNNNYHNIIDLHDNYDIYDGCILQNISYNIPMDNFSDIKCYVNLSNFKNYNCFDQN